jgi:hypothetical protein
VQLLYWLVRLWLQLEDPLGLPGLVRGLCTAVTAVLTVAGRLLSTGGEEVAVEPWMPVLATAFAILHQPVTRRALGA